MKLSPFHLTFVIALLFNTPFAYAQKGKKAQWKVLQESAQKIGLCLYMANMPDDQCTCMMHDGDKAYMAVPNRGWAKTRLLGWMKQQEHLMIYDAILIYDRGTSTERGDLEKGYFAVNLGDLAPLATRKGNGNQYTFTFSTKSEGAILNNTYWREFISNREGRSLNSGTWTFNTMEHDEAKNFVLLFNAWVAAHQ